MQPDGVAIFYRDNLRGEEVPIQFIWGTDARSIEQAWHEAMEKLSARDADELRREGYSARLVSLTPILEEDIGQRGFMESCLRQVEVDVEGGDCTSHAGNEFVTETLLEARLTTDTIRVPLSENEPALPEFSADYRDCLDGGDVELPLYFILKDRTPTHAVYSVQEWEKPAPPSRGKMAPSSRSLWETGRVRKRG
jgi:hypothetical protein